MSTHFPLISAAQTALRAVVTDTTTDTLDQLDKALSALPLTEVSDGTERLVRFALDRIGRARDHELARALRTVESAVADMLIDGPRLPVRSHPAMQAVTQAIGQCYAGASEWSADSAFRRPWERAIDAGADMVRAVADFLYEDSAGTPSNVRRRLKAFGAEARRATAYHARDLARTALSAVSNEYGRFVIGARTPGCELDTWFRWIGGRAYQFEVTASEWIAPAGRLIVTDHATGQAVHDLPLSADVQRWTTVNTALELI